MFRVQCFSRVVEANACAAPQVPLAVISGHSKAVSYVRFMGGSHVVSASTDDTLKLWDVSRATGSGSTRPDATFRGAAQLWEP